MYFGWQKLRSPKRNMKVIQFCSYDFCSYDITILLIDDIPSFKTDWNLFPITANLAFRCQNLCPVHCGFHLRHNRFLIQFQQRCFTWTRSPWSHLQVTSWPSRAPSKLDLYISTPRLSPPSWLPSPVLVIASPQPRGEWGPQVTYMLFKCVIKLNPYPVSALFPYSHRCEF